MLATLDSYAAGCIDSSIGRKGPLDPERLSILTECADKLRLAVEQLHGEPRSYFAELLFLSEGVLRSART
jgi:hypothetical protein